ncbi:helix-turn-helix domain-containing protein [Sphingobium naphthae]|nr:helix-turn-helix domain-containing protein [Sphingobium naphthae]
MSAPASGFDLIRAAYDAEGLNEHERAVLVRLAFMANEEACAWPSVAHLVEKTGASERTVQRAIVQLTAAGHIKREERAGRGVVYLIHPRQSGTPVRVAPPSERRPTPVRVAPHPRQSDTQTTNELPSNSQSSVEEDDQDDEKAKPEHFVEAWNALAARLGKPTIRSLTAERRQKLKARLAEYPIADFKAVLANIERSAFLRDGRFLTFDWIIGKANFLKVLEGNYNR